MSAQRVVGGRYRLGDQLGAGGFGRVWRAYDDVLDVEVAVKEVWLPQQAESGTARTERVARAAREARNAAKLRDHPHIVAVHDVVVEDGVPWIVMRLVEGRSLADVLEGEGPLASARVAEVGLALLQALEAAHAVGVVHRDLKPANVMLTAQGQVLLTDFGIAVHEADTKLTSTGGIIGSVEYMAPERLNGIEDEGASDLFSLGVTLYEAVQGVSPFRRTTATATLTAVVLHDPPPPQRAHPELARLITELLMKKPENRPNVAEALTRLRGARTAPAPAPVPIPPSPMPPPNPPYAQNPGYGGYPAAPPASPRNNKRRRGWIIGASVAVALALVVSLIVVLSKGDSDKPGAAADGVLTDQTTGLSVPRIKGWDAPSLGTAAHQFKGAYPCPADDKRLGCYLGEVAVYSLRADTFQKAVSELMEESGDNEEFTLLKTGRNEFITVDGRPGFWLTAELRIKQPDNNGTQHGKVAQIVVIDNPYDVRGKRTYPFVIASVDTAPGSPPKTVLDTVREGIKVGTPHPVST